MLKRIVLLIGVLVLLTASPIGAADWESPEITFGATSVEVGSTTWVEDVFVLTGETYSFELYFKNLATNGTAQCYVVFEVLGAVAPGDVMIELEDPGEYGVYWIDLVVDESFRTTRELKITLVPEDLITKAFRITGNATGTYRLAVWLEDEAP